MKKPLFLILSFSLFILGSFIACDEVEEVNKYDNWKERNQHFVDSIAALAADRLVPQTSEFTEKGEKVDDIAVGEMFALETTASTTVGKQYVYCKKLSVNKLGEKPKYTDMVRTYYYGTNILGERFDGNFKGYSAVDRSVLNPQLRLPLISDEPVDFTVGGVIPGWIAALTYMRSGERWMLYIPCESAYGSEEGDATMPAYSALTFDLQLVSILK